MIDYQLYKSQPLLYLACMLFISNVNGEQLWMQPLVNSVQFFNICQLLGQILSDRCHYRSVVNKINFLR